MLLVSAMSVHHLVDGCRHASHSSLASLNLQIWRVVAPAKLEAIHVGTARRSHCRRGRVGEKAMSKGDSPSLGGLAPQ